MATAEIQFGGDNDQLAARNGRRWYVLTDVLVLLSDIDGLYTASPRLLDPLAAEHLPVDGPL